MHSLSVDDLYRNKCITVRCKTVKSKINAYVMTLNALDQSVFKKLSSKSRTNCWKLYKACTNVIRSLITFSAYILRMSVQLSEVDVKKSFDADWMSVRLKKEIAVVLLIKSMFV